MKTEKSPWPRLLPLIAAILCLSALLNLDYPAGPLVSWRLLLPSADVWLLTGVMALAACGGRRPLFWTWWAVTILFLALRVFRIGETAVPMYLNRPFNLYIDSRYLLSVYDLLVTSARQGAFPLMAAGSLMAVLGVIAASACAWWLSGKALSDRRCRTAFLAGSALVLASGPAVGWHAFEPPAVVRFGRELYLTRQRVAQAGAFARRLENAAKDMTPGAGSLKGLEGADVLLFIVESYGRTVFSRPQYRAKMTATMTAFGRTLARHGFLAVSDYLVSPTYGGISRLAHATLESGLRVSDDLQENALLRSDLPPLAAYFRAGGYRTLSVMPGTRFAFPQGAYFGYDQAYYAADFNYQGPAFGWAPMPDQFVLDRVRRREFARRDKPLFVRYVLISSHAAFNIQPPFIPDWDLIGDGRIYHDRPPIYFPVFWPDLKNAEVAYLRSLAYEFETLGDYLAKYVTADSLIIILGDHQPNPQLTDPDEPWSVPVHVISRNPRLLAPFRQRGYTPGVMPDQLLPHAGMERFMPDFLSDFR